MNSPTDQLHRPLRELRLSLTDRCNFRCGYCMPKSVFGPGYRFLPQEALLSFDEIERLARVFIDLGVKKIRLTGGEPLLREGIETLIERVARTGVELTLTTNGARLRDKAAALFAAGLDRLSVSLDALDDPTFRAINGVDFPVREVLDGIDAAEAAGFAAININMVVKRSANLHQILPMADHFRASPHTLRLIEYMDVGSSNGWQPDDVVSAREMLALIEQHHALVPRPRAHGETARRFRYQDGHGEIGIIASVSEPFCAQCTRARVSAQGRLYTCLFATEGVDLRAIMNDRSTDEARQAIAALWAARADQYSALRDRAIHPLRKIEMSYIGG